MQRRDGEPVDDATFHQIAKTYQYDCSCRIGQQSTPASAAPATTPAARRPDGSAHRSDHQQPHEPGWRLLLPRVLRRGRTATAPELPGDVPVNLPSR